MYLDKSLQAIKTDLAKKEATLKTIQKHYPHLKKLSEKEILSYFQVTTIDELSKHIKQLKESPISHTMPIMDNSTMCTCKDSKGQQKDLYDTQEIAQQEADQLMLNKVLKLKVYPCPYGYVWHLTKV